MPLDGLHHGEVSQVPLVTGIAVGLTGGGVIVTIPAWDLYQQWGPCPYTPHGASVPTVGTKCLVAFPIDDNPWVVAWIGPWTDEPN